jgi:hypothetical protein
VDHALDQGDPAAVQSRRPAGVRAAAHQVDEVGWGRRGEVRQHPGIEPIDVALVSDHVGH